MYCSILLKSVGSHLKLLTEHEKLDMGMENQHKPLIHIHMHGLL